MELDTTPVATATQVETADPAKAQPGNLERLTAPAAMQFQAEIYRRRWFRNAVGNYVARMAGGCEVSAAGIAHRARVEHYRAVVGNHMEDVISARSAAVEGLQPPRRVLP